MGALALAVLWGAYYLPQRLRHRNQLIESRVDDRFSGSLRILAVATRSTAEGSAEECSSRASKRNKLLTPAMGVVVAGTNGREVEGVRNMDQPQAGTDRAPSFSPAPSRRPAPARPPRESGTVSGGPGPAVHAARAAAARRRLILTLALLGLSVTTWIVSAATAFPIAVPVIATALLGTVLVLGRRAVVAGQRTDAARAARLRGEVPPEARRRSRPTSVVVGRAIHGNQANTEMISSSEVGKRLDQTTTGVVADDADAETAGDVDRAADAVVEQEVTAEAATAKGESTSETADAGTAPEQGGELSTYSVPRSTYVSKAAAPRREPAPLTADDVTTPATASARAQATRTAEEHEELTPSPDGLGVDLNQILARRRAAGA